MWWTEILHIAIAMWLCAFSLIGWGTWLIRVALRQESADFCLPEYGLAGFAVAAIAGMAIHLFFPLSARIATVFCIGGGGALADHFRRLSPEQKRCFPRSVMGGILFLAIGAGALRAFGMMLYDTGYYHLPAILWQHQRAIAPGLANLHGELGFNSIWFTLCAMAWLPYLGLTAAFSLNTVILVFLLWTLFHESRVAPGVFSPSKVFALMVLGMLSMLCCGKSLIYYNIGSPSTDLPAAVFVLYAFYLALRQLEMPPQQTLDKASFAMLLIVCLLAITVKMSTVPVALLPLLVLNRTKFSDLTNLPRSVFFFLGAFAALWLLRGILISGYVFYPQRYTYLGHLPWSVPATMADFQENWVKGFARIPYAPMSDVLGTWRWFPEWFCAFQSDKFVRLMVALSVLGALLVASRHPLRAQLEKYSWSASEERLWHQERVALGGAVGVVLVALFFWFMEAPDIRFALGFMMAGGALGAATGIWCLRPGSIFEPVARWGVNLCLGLIVIKCLVHSVHTAPQPASEAWPVIPAVRAVENHNVEGQVVYSPARWIQCWTIPQPCTPNFSANVVMHAHGPWTVFENHSRDKGKWTSRTLF